MTQDQQRPAEPTAATRMIADYSVEEEIWAKPAWQVERERMDAELAAAGLPPLAPIED